MFDRLEPGDSVVDRCAQSLRTAILQGKLRPGERLPAERKLAETFGINRVTIRGALAQLHAAHLVSVRQGSGYVVRDFLRAGGPDLIDQIAQLAADEGQLADVVRDLLAVRRALAAVVLERLVDRPDVDVSKIREAIDRFSGVVDADDRAIAHADLEVLAEILAATGSRVLGLFFNPVMRVVTTLPALRRAMYAEPTTNVAGYGVLLAWLDSAERPPLDVMIAELERRDTATVKRIEEMNQ